MSQPGQDGLAPAAAGWVSAGTVKGCTPPHASSTPPPVPSGNSARERAIFHPGQYGPVFGAGGPEAELRLKSWSPPQPSRTYPWLEPLVATAGAISQPGQHGPPPREAASQSRRRAPQPRSTTPPWPVLLRATLRARSDPTTLPMPRGGEEPG